jgi:hypothetical protein
MKTLTRSQAIADLRRKLLQLVDERSSLCLVAARRGLFCNGFGRWDEEELEQRFPGTVRRGPGSTRADVEKQANRQQLRLQDVGAGRLPCDLTPDRRSLLCAGWDEFYESELAQFYRELCGEDVRVVPDELLEGADRQPGF